MNTKAQKWSCCYAVAMLPFCFLWSLSTRGDHRYVIYDSSWFVCRNKELGNELQPAELNAYLVAKDSFLVAKAFQKLKMCRGLYTQGMVGVAKKIAQLRNFDRLYLGHFLSEIHKWPLILFLKSYTVFQNTFCGQIRKKKFWPEVLLTKVTDAQYRKRFRVSYNLCRLTWNMPNSAASTRYMLTLYRRASQKSVAGDR